jgi:hypothetical protein
MIKNSGRYLQHCMPPVSVDASRPLSVLTDPARIPALAKMFNR